MDHKEAALELQLFASQNGCSKIGEAAMMGSYALKSLDQLREDIRLLLEALGTTDIKMATVRAQKLKWRWK